MQFFIFPRFWLDLKFSLKMKTDIVGHSGMGAALKESMNDDRDQKQAG